MSLAEAAAAQMQVLQSDAPAAAALLSPLGRRAVLPLGIPQQSAQAAGCERQATIGQITASNGRPLALPAVAVHFAGLDDKQALLYAPTAGLKSLREAWRKRIGVENCSLPVVTTGMSHGVSLVADLFGCPEQPLVLAAPYWDNYDTIWHMRTEAPMRRFPFFDTVGRFNLAGLGDRLAELAGPATLLLNFPNNPTGYAPTHAEVEALVARIHAHPHPLAVLCDDAYQGLYWGEDCFPGSIFASLVNGSDPARLLVCKVDGATKELVFFGGRVGFLTFGVSGRAGEVLADKAAAVLRGTISSAPAASQAVVLAALGDPQLVPQQEEVRGVLRRRYLALRHALDAENVEYWPFNSGCFAMIRLAEHQLAADIRLRLIREQSTGVIEVTGANALRVAFCSVDEADIPNLVARIARVVNNVQAPVS